LIWLYTIHRLDRLGCHFHGLWCCH